jgi:predicted  nucleic acid-binding Zn-ribbon protein
MRDIRNLMMGLLSVGLITTWVYHLYDKAGYSNRRREIFIKDSAAVAQGVQDSMHKIFSSTIHDLGNRLDSTKLNADKLEGELNSKLGEINNLKNKIATILKKRDFNRGDLSNAKQLTKELRDKIDELQNQNQTIEEEKKKLVTDFEKLNTQVAGLTQNNRKLDEENKTLNEKLAEAGTFITSEMRIQAIHTRGNKEIETSLAKKAEKFVISFFLQNNVSNYENAEIFVVITDPNNEILEFSAWDTGFFETKSEGRKKYTRKTRFAYTKGESYQVVFSLNAPAYVKGNYMMQVYHNGKQVGKTVISLS